MSKSLSPATAGESVHVVRSAPATTDAPRPESLRSSAQDAVSSVERVVRGKREAIQVVLAAILARGHVLLEDVPGVGKTTLARGIAIVLGASYQRIQFTADLLPADVIGVQILRPQDGTFVFRRGPLFAQMVLADEINRASPKTQSALLEAMADRQVSVENETHLLPAPFHVLATQNPIEHHGAYPLPESQLDRFMVRVHLGYPPPDDELSLLLAQREAQEGLDDLRPHMSSDLVVAAQRAVSNITMDESVGRYLLALVERTRQRSDISLGCSPRGALAWSALARAWAFLDGRTFVLPDDVKRLAMPVLVHRLGLRGGSGLGNRHQTEAIVDEICNEVPVPR